MTGLADLARSEWADPAEVFLERIDAATRRPEWHQHALCRGQMENGKSLWFSQRASERAEAQRICDTCPVQAQCHTAGADQFGMWGDSFQKPERYTAA